MLREVSLKPSPELSYIIGVLFGDGTLDVGKRGERQRNVYEVSLTQKDLEFAEAFNKAACKILGKKEPYKINFWQNKYYRVRVHSKVLVEFLQPRQLERFTDIIKAYPVDFIKGFADSEGSVTISAYKSKLKFGERTYLYCIIAVTNASIKVIKKSKERVIENRIVHFRRDAYDLLIRKLSSIEKFQQLIGFRVTTKDRKLEDFLKLKKAEIISRQRKWKQYWKDRVRRVCFYCGRKFETLRHEQRYFCSHHCLRKAGGNLKTFLNKRGMMLNCMVYSS